MRDRSRFVAPSIVALVALTRVLFRSHQLYDLDSVNFALAMGRFDPSSHQPHPPGYFLYVCLGRLVNRLIPDPNSALVAISIVASCAAAWTIYLFTREWFGREAGVWALVLFLVSPLAWFHGVVALTYIVEAFFSALVGYCCWRVYTGNPAYAIPASMIVALAAGFRPSSGLFLGPLWLYSIWRVGGLRRWVSIGAAAAVGLAWAIPMMQAAGGIGHYLGALGQLVFTIPAKRTTLSSGWLAIARMLTIAWIEVMCFGAAAGLFIWKGGPGAKVNRRFLWTWLTPGLLFFSFVFLSYVNSGYLLILSPPLFALLGARLYGFWEGGSRTRGVAVVALGAAFNIGFFLFAPLYTSWTSIRNFERDAEAIAADFRTGLDPESTMIIGFDAHFLGYRHAGYLLPRFVTVQFPEATFDKEKRVFIMHERDTRVVREFAVDQFRQFVFFPLPEGDEYTEYFEQKVRAKLPEGTLHAAMLGKRPVLVGPVSAVPLLFPTTARYATQASAP